MPIWHIDQLKTLLGTVEIGLIKDESNDLALRRGPCPELRPLGDNLADMVAKARMATQAASTNTTPIESILGSSTAPSSLAKPLSLLWSLLLGSGNYRHRWLHFSITSSL